ncbi:MAG: beta-lactamase family protein [Oligoflexia bacterium]|nr:beta-lactamase family protein [Oligoflexia bacterium]
MPAVPGKSLRQINPEIFGEVSTYLRQGAEDGVFPGAVLLVGRAGQVLHRESVGVRSLEGEQAQNLTHPDLVYDVAGLTQIMVTASLMMKLVEAEQVRLEDRVSRYIQSFGVLGKSPITVAQVLSHRSGLPSWMPFYEDLLRENAGARMGILTSKGAREFIYNQINRAELDFEPGSKQIYSDVGFILLGHLVEILTGTSFERAAQRLVFQPLGLKSTSFIDLSLVKRRGIAPVATMIAPTEQCSWRKRMLCGEVHDDNAWAMGGISGHSGLFSNAADIHRFATEMLDAARGQSTFVPKNVVRLFWAPTVEGQATGWRFGWDSPSDENEMVDVGFGKYAVGMNGLTGCSLWIDPEMGLDIVFLCNRVHPTSNNKKIRGFRPGLHSAILKAVRSL